MDDQLIDADMIEGREKAALLLLSLGEETSTKIFAKLENYEISALAEEMENIEKIPDHVFEVVAQEFIQKFEQEGSFVVQGSQFVKSVMSKALDEDKVESIYKDMVELRAKAPFAWTKNVSSSVIARHIIKEHPQTIAMIMAYLPPEVAAEVMMTIPVDKQGDIALRIINIREVSEKIIFEVDEVLKKELAMLRQGAGKMGGIPVVVNILNSVDKLTEESIIGALEEKDGELATEVRNQMFVFDDLENLDNSAIQELLKAVDNSQLAYALKTTSDSLKEKIYQNLSSRAAEMIDEEISYMGPVRLSEVEEAQQAIVQEAKRLEAEGKIVIRGRGPEDVFI